MTKKMMASNRIEQNIVKPVLNSLLERLLIELSSVLDDE